MKFEVIPGKPQFPPAPAAEPDSPAASGSLLPQTREALHGILDLRDQLEELRQKLISYGPVWYDEDEDNRLAASLALLDRMMPESSGELGPALVTGARKPFVSARS